MPEQNEQIKTASEKKAIASRDYLSKITSSIAVGAAVLTLVVAIIAFFIEPPEREIDTFKYYSMLREDFESQQAEIKAIKNRIRDLTKIDPSINSGNQLVAIQSELKTVLTRIETLEKGLLANPEKALSLPLLRKDLENLEKIYKQDIEAMASNVDRVYDQNKWFIGLMFTMAIGLIGLAASNFVQARKN